jgi:hypothetical protein
MPGPGLPTGVTAGTSGHIGHSNTVHALANLLDTVTGQPLSTVVNTQTASYTLVLADALKMVEMNVASANNLTVPPNSSVAFPVGTVVYLRQYGAGQTTLVQGAGVTIRSRGAALKLNGQYAEGMLTKRATDEWVLSGDITV